MICTCIPEPVCCVWPCSWSTDQQGEYEQSVNLISCKECVFLCRRQLHTFLVLKETFDCNCIYEQSMRATINVYSRNKAALGLMLCKVTHCAARVPEITGLYMWLILHTIYSRATFSIQKDVVYRLFTHSMYHMYRICVTSWPLCCSWPTSRLGTFQAMLYCLPSCFRAEKRWGCLPCLSTRHDHFANYIV